MGGDLFELIFGRLFMSEIMLTRTNELKNCNKIGFIPSQPFEPLIKILF